MDDGIHDTGGQCTVMNNYMLFFVFYYLKRCCYLGSGDTTTNNGTFLRSKADGWGWDKDATPSSYTGSRLGGVVTTCETIALK